MPKCGLFVGSLAWSLAEVASVRQNADIASAVHVVEQVGELLQERSMGTQELVHQLSEYANAAVTPGAGASFANSLKVVVQDLEAKIEKKITDGQAATQRKLDTLFQGLEAANAAANTAKKSAVSNDNSWFTCAANEKTKRQVAEHAEKSLKDATSDESQVCQRHQDNTGFKYDGAGKFKMDFACDHSIDGSCEAALKAWDENALQKLYADAEAHMAKEEKSHDTLKASCDAKTQARAEAKSTLDSAESAWSTKRAACQKLASQRQTSMCAFGTKAQAKCSAEAEYAKLVAATKQAKGDADSEVDRKSEWLAAGASKCMITNAIQKGLNGAVAGADLDACAAQVNFDQDVGKLNTRQAEFDTLSKANACADGSITFFNGKTWNVPSGDRPSSKSYTEAEFTPQLDPSSGNFDFCSAPAPAPSSLCGAGYFWRVLNLDDCGWRPAVTKLAFFADVEQKTALEPAEIISSGWDTEHGTIETKGPQLAVDGLANTSWRPQVHAPHAKQVWIGARFAEPTAVVAVEAVGLGIGSGGGQSWSGGIELQKSDDGVTWASVARKANSDTIVLEDDCGSASS